MRVVGGHLGGRRLRAPPGDAARPTSDRVREALFAWLGSVEGAHVLDAYAGSGAVGIEAISRGAAGAVFLERGGASLRTLHGNLHSLDVGNVSRVVSGDAVASIRRLGREGARFDLVFIDPPYASGEAERALAAIVAAGILAPGGTLVVEASRRHPVAAVAGLLEVEERRYGDTTLFRFAADADAEEPDPQDPGPRPAGGSTEA